MKKFSWNEIGYYLSCMIPFNLIYLIMMLNKGMYASIKKYIEYCNQGFFLIKPRGTTIINYITAFITIFFILFGLVATVNILNKDDSIKNKSTLGKSIVAVNVEDLTSENYFGNFSLIVLTGLSLPVWEHIYSLIIYLIIIVMLGIVYIKKKIIYINPILSLKNYNIFRCKNKTMENGRQENYIFVIKDGSIKEGEKITFKNISNRIIRINNKKD